MQITRVICPENKYPIKCPDIVNMEGITVHNSYNDATAMAETSYMLGRPEKVSFHVAVDNYRIVEGLPLNRSCYAAGDGRYGYGNSKTINIEICYSKTGGDRFTEAELNAAEYIAYLLKLYGWGIERVGTHQMRSGKYCPHRTLDLGWERFLNLISMFLNKQTEINNNVEDNDGSDVEVKTYKNGSTRENVFSDTSCTDKIGSLNPREKCDCLGIFNDRAMVRYKVDKKNNYKIGYCKWLGGVN